MLTGILAVRNLMLDEAHDVWSVNTDPAYHEEVAEGDPRRLVETLELDLGDVFLKLDRVALGLSVGAAGGLGLGLATLALVLAGGGGLGASLALLGQYFPGDRVTPGGSLLGLVYGFGAGFVGGWGFAFLRNAALVLSLAVLRRRAELRLLRRFLELV
jgi:hypothetical protein